MTFVFIIKGGRRASAAATPYLFGFFPLEGAPVPVARHAHGYFGRVRNSRTPSEPSWRRNDGAGRSRAVEYVGRVQAGRVAVGTAAPLLELREAVLARPARGATRVEVCLLVEGHFEVAVRVAEDIATLSAVVPSREIVEVPLAGGVVTDVGLLVGLESRDTVSVTTAAGNKDRRDTVYAGDAPCERIARVRDRAENIPSSASLSVLRWAGGTCRDPKWTRDLCRCRQSTAG